MAEHFKEWLEKVFFPNAGKQNLLKFDSWSGHCSEVVENTTSKNKKVSFFQIPEGTTGKIQSLVCFDFVYGKILSDIFQTVYYF